MPASATAARVQSAPQPIELSEIFREHYGSVWSVVRRSGVRSADVDDVVQEVFLVIQRRLPGFEGRSSIRTWVLAVAYRVTIAHLRKHRSRATHGVPELPVSVPQQPDEATAQREAVLLLDTLLGKLDAKKRIVFTLIEIEELSAPEVAEALGVKLNTVYSRLRLARRDFERALARHQAAVRSLPRDTTTGAAPGRGRPEGER